MKFPFLSLLQGPFLLHNEYTESALLGNKRTAWYIHPESRTRAFLRPASFLRTVHIPVKYRRTAWSKITDHIRVENCIRCAEEMPTKLSKVNFFARTNIGLSRLFLGLLLFLNMAFFRTKLFLGLSRCSKSMVLFRRFLRFISYGGLRGQWHRGNGHDLGFYGLILDLVCLLAWIRAVLTRASQLLAMAIKFLRPFHRFSIVSQSFLDVAYILARVSFIISTWFLDLFYHPRCQT